SKNVEMKAGRAWSCGVISSALPLQTSKPVDGHVEWWRFRGGLRVGSHQEAFAIRADRVTTARGVLHSKGHVKQRLGRATHEALAVCLHRHSHHLSVRLKVEQFPAIAAPVRITPTAYRDLRFFVGRFPGRGPRRLPGCPIAPGFVGCIGQPAAIWGNRALDFRELAVEQSKRLLVSVERKREQMRVLHEDDELAIARPVCWDLYE